MMKHGVHRGWPWRLLNAIQNFGAMDVLCTDKTGTLTMDQVILQKHCDVMQKEDAEVFQDAYLIAHFQTGLKNVLDRAVLNHRDTSEEIIRGFNKVDEIPFDFVRRMMSVVVETPDKDRQLLTKGAPEAVFPRCAFYELDGKVSPMDPEIVAQLGGQYQQLSADGFRVLAVAHKHLAEDEFISKEDECELILKGCVAFLDPPKDSAAKAIDALQQHGVTVKVLTGDNDLVTRKVCRQVGLNADDILLGSKVETMSDDELAEAEERTHIFARLSPAHKQRIIRALQSKGHVVGFMGDGINDAPALHVADVGISVDSAVDIAKAAASVILLEKELIVLDDGVIEGRKVFVNILKYVSMGASSNFGNRFSVLGASAFLPYVPMLPIQVLTNKCNGRLAVLITNAVSTMWCAYVFTAIALISLPAALAGGTAAIISWVAQTFLQLVLLSVIMVGQKVSAQASDKQALQTYRDAEALLKIQDELHRLLKVNTQLTDEIHQLLTEKADRQPQIPGSQ